MADTPMDTFTQGCDTSNSEAVCIDAQRVYDSCGEQDYTR